LTEGLRRAPACVTVRRPSHNTGLPTLHRILKPHSGSDNPNA
jgi:hypothetical protein